MRLSAIFPSAFLLAGLSVAFTASHNSMRAARRELYARTSLERMTLYARREAPRPVPIDIPPSLRPQARPPRPQAPPPQPQTPPPQPQTPPPQQYARLHTPPPPPPNTPVDGDPGRGFHFWMHGGGWLTDGSSSHDRGEW